VTLSTVLGRVAAIVAAASLAALTGCGGGNGPSELEPEATLSGTSTRSTDDRDTMPTAPGGTPQSRATADVRRVCARVPPPAASAGPAAAPVVRGGSGTGRRPAPRGGGPEAKAVELQRAVNVSGAITAAVDAAPARERSGLLALQAAYDALRAAASADASAMDTGDAVTAAHARVDATADRLGVTECRATPGG
jgi:predicted small lipoprotein YifL